MLENHKDLLRNNDLGILVLRLGTGGMMLFHGVHKAVYGIAGIGGMLASMGLPSSLAYGVLLGELVAPILMVLGVWTRAASAVLCLNMVVAILMAHAGVLWAVDATTGAWAVELPALYLFGALALCFTGGGKYALTKGTVLD